MHLEPFAGAKFKMLRAAQHLSELIRVLTEYNDSVKISFESLGESRWRLKASKDVPVNSALAIGDAVHNMRSALDQIVCDAATLRGKSTAKMSYPFEQSKASFDARLTGSAEKAPFKKIGQDVVNIIKSSRPYHDGNQILRGLHDLDIRDKHRVLVPVTSFASISNNIGEMAMAHLRLVRPDLSNFRVATISDLRVGIGLGEEFTLPLGGDPEIIYPRDAAQILHIFPKGEPCAGKGVVETLDKMYVAVSELFEKFLDLFGIGFGMPDSPPIVSFADLHFTDPPAK